MNNIVSQKVKLLENQGYKIVHEDHKPHWIYMKKDNLVCVIDQCGKVTWGEHYDKFH
jgi:hypothetical protein